MIFICLKSVYNELTIDQLPVGFDSCLNQRRHDVVTKGKFANRVLAACTQHAQCFILKKNISKISSELKTWVTSTRIRFRLKTNFFSPFHKKIQVHTYRFEIVFAVRMAHEIERHAGCCRDVLRWRRFGKDKLISRFLAFGTCAHEHTGQRTT